MNILIATFSFPARKLEVYDGKFVFFEAAAYARAGAKVRVVTPHFSGADSIENLEEGIRVFRFKYFFPSSLEKLRKAGVPIYEQKSFLSLLQIPFFCLFFSIAILKHAMWADIIHAQWTLSGLLALPAKWFLKKKLVITARGTDLRAIPRWVNRYIHKRVNGAIDCFGPQPWNERYKKSYTANYVRLPLIVHNDASETMPVDMEEQLHGKKGPLIILYVGRFDRFKLDHDKLPLLDLIRSTKMLKDGNAFFHLFYVGDGDETIKGELGKLIGETHLQNDVTLLGGKLNVLDYMKFSHLGVGGIAFNAVSQEFTVLKKPQLLVDSPDNRHTPWRHGTNSLFFKPGDTVDLAHQLKWALNHPEKLSAMGKRANEDMREYISDSKTGGKLYLEAFENL